MRESGWNFIPAAFFLVVNFSVSGVKYLYFSRLTYFLFLIFLFLVLRRVNLRVILPPVVFGISLILFLYGLIQKFFLFPVYIKQLTLSGRDGQTFYSQALLSRIASGRIFSLFVLPTLYALVCGILLVFILHYFLTARKWGRFSWLLVGVLGGLNLLLTQSFGGILCSFLAVLFYLFYSRILKVKYLAPLVMILSLIFFVVVALRFSEARTMEPLKLRFSNWAQAARMASQSPLFGVGLGNYESEVSVFEKPGEASSIYAHNFILQWTAETGLFFLVLLIAASLMFGIKNYRLFLVRENIVFTSVILLVAVYNLIDIGIYFFAAGMALAICLSQVLPAAGNAERMPQLTALIVLSVILLFGQFAEDARKTADFWASRQEYGKAESAFRKSLKWNPFSYRPLMGMAVIRDLEGRSGEAKSLLESFLFRVPRSGYANYLLSKICYREGAYLTALYRAELAMKSNRRESRYRKWHESIKTELQNQLVRPGN